MNPVQQAELVRLYHQELLRQMHEQRWSCANRQPSLWQRLLHSLTQRRPQQVMRPGLKLAQSK